jgi:hypothetical protein
MFGGQRSQKLVYDHETLWHALEEGDGGVWMTSLPIEQRQTDELVAEAHGRVLVGGLGIGYAVAALSGKKAVKTITVVEKEPDVIRLVEPWLQRNKKPVTVVHADLFDYLHDLPDDPHSWQFDWALYDIWQGDNEYTFHHTVAPLRKLSAGKVPDSQIVCWAEDVMRGQLLNGLNTRILMAVAARMPDDDLVSEGQRKMAETYRLHAPVEKLATVQNDIWNDWAVPFWQWFQRTEPTKEDAEQMAHAYVQVYARYAPDVIEARLFSARAKATEGEHQTAGVASKAR